ncbi:hypothetical protein EDM00_00685 [Ornithobacterium rhinotracheale]|nr:hypothetical protein [Ornithobacterium rhinotracheale]MRJ10234.1 hypothetical protein [Ornithobacterium rhinotracheale]
MQKYGLKYLSLVKIKNMNIRQKILFTALVLIELVSIVLWFMEKIDLIVFILIMAIVGLGLGFGMNQLRDSNSKK